MCARWYVITNDGPPERTASYRIDTSNRPTVLRGATGFIDRLERGERASSRVEGSLNRPREFEN